ncbi:MAG: hypothetical protein SGJ19_08525 [Planctomycetia bacterium]|nr:hypothetical protein [Planctomycetia bacterium]
MLVIISDLHLTDGTSGETIAAGAFQIFAERLQDLAAGASCRADGNYRPIERLDLLLLGDVLDVIRSARWSASRVRPWDDPQSSEYVDIVGKITADILRRNDEAFQILRSLALQSGITVPPADSMGRPVPTAAGQPVDVRIHYMVGNHDWFYHLGGPAYDVIRQAVARSLGLANTPTQPFPHDPAENDELLGLMRRHRVFARHGDVYDPFNFEGERNASSLGDAIVIDLLNRFAFIVETELANELPISTLAGLRELDNVRPILLIPVWLDGLLERTCPLPSMRKQVKRVWDRLVDDFLSVSFVRSRDTWSPTDLVDGLEQALKFSKQLSVGWASSVVSWLNSVRGRAEDSFYAHALAEQDFRNRRAKHIVYGHTHHAETVPLDASYAEGYVLNQVYFNSGTWRRVHQQTRLAPNEHEFIPSDVMTYLAFFQGDERKGRPYETWTGTLGHQPSEKTIHRVDAPPSTHVSQQPLSPSRVSGHAPHFTALPARAGIVPSRRQR